MDYGQHDDVRCLDLVEDAVGGATGSGLGEGATGKGPGFGITLSCRRPEGQGSGPPLHRKAGVRSWGQVSHRSITDASGTASGAAAS